MCLVFLSWGNPCTSLPKIEEVMSQSGEVINERHSLEISREQKKIRRASPSPFSPLFWVCTFFLPSLHIVLRNTCLRLYLQNFKLLCHRKREGKKSRWFMEPCTRGVREEAVFYIHIYGMTVLQSRKKRVWDKNLFEHPSNRPIFLK